MAIKEKHGSMLTEQEFNQKHAVKYQGLPAAQRRQRYDDYVLSESGQRNQMRGANNAPRNNGARVNNALRGASQAVVNPSAIGRRVQTLPPSQRPSNRQPSANTVQKESRKEYEEMVAEYLTALRDPFSKEAADVKQPSFHGYPSTTFQVKEPFVVKTDPAGNFCMIVTDDLDRFRADSWTTATVPSSINPKLQILTDNTNAANPKFKLSTLVSPADYKSDVLSVFSPCTETEGIKDIYSSFRTSSMGVTLEYSAAPVDAKGRICSLLWHPSETLPYSKDPSEPPADFAIAFEDLLEFEAANTFAAIDGTTLYWVPFGDDVTELRPVRASEKRDHVGTPVNNPEALGSSLRGDGYALRVLTQLALEGAFDDSPERFTGGKFARVLDRSLSSNSPALLICGSGLVPDTEVFQGTIAWNVESVADERTLNFASKRLIGEVGSKASLAAEAQDSAIAVARQLPSSTEYKPNSAQITEAEKEAATEVGNESTDSGSSWMSTALEGVETVAGIGEVLAAFL